MDRVRLLSFVGLLGCVATPAVARETAATPSPIALTGSVALASDYRFRGVSQSDEDRAVQGGLTIAHESGLDVGTWVPNLAGWGTVGGGNMELDPIGGYEHALSDGATVDAGLTWYMDPGGADETDFAESSIKPTGVRGPLAGARTAPDRSPMARSWRR